MGRTDLAPWIAIAITLALSILVPLFTQIANNVHQRKLLHDKFNHEEQQEKVKVFVEFLSEVGGLISANGHVDKENLTKAGAALHKLYIYAPKEWYNDLEILAKCLMKFKWEEAQPILLKLDRLVYHELSTTPNATQNRGRIR